MLEVKNVEEMRELLNYEKKVTDIIKNEVESSFKKFEEEVSNPTEVPDNYIAIWLPVTKRARSSVINVLKELHKLGYGIIRKGSRQYLPSFRSTCRLYYVTIDSSSIIDDTTLMEVEKDSIEELFR